MNKVVVGHAPSPNLMKVQSRIGSLANHDHKVGDDDDVVIIVNNHKNNKKKSRIRSLANNGQKVVVNKWMAVGE